MTNAGMECIDSTISPLHVLQCNSETSVTFCDTTLPHDSVNVTVECLAPACAIQNVGKNALPTKLCASQYVLHNMCRWKPAQRVFHVYTNLRKYL